MLAGRQANAETVAGIRHSLGSTNRFMSSMGAYVGGLAQGDLGRSYQQRTEIRTLLFSRLPATLQLTAGGIVLELLFGIPLGILAALFAGRALDKG